MSKHARRPGYVEFCGKREVVKAGFNYQAAYTSCNGERESAGYLWHFKVEQ